MVDRSPQGVMRRVVGYHDIRMDGMSDLLMRARGASVLDIGCNRGMVGFEFAHNGARLVHGCDNAGEVIRTAKEVFADIRSVESKFEVVDLTRGPEALRHAFGDARYDMVLFLAIYHKLARVMDARLLSDLVCDLGRRTTKYLAWRATDSNYAGNAAERKLIDGLLNGVGLKCVQWSQLSTLGTAAIWERKG